MNRTTKEERRIAKKGLLLMKRVNRYLGRNTPIPSIAEIARTAVRAPLGADHDPIPYTHWMYFPDEQSAQKCASALPEYRARVDPPLEGREEWLLRAARETTNLLQRHKEVESIVVMHGGCYDGGETTLGPDGFIDDPFCNPGTKGASDGSRSHNGV